MTPDYFVGGWPATNEQSNAITLALNGQETKRSLKIEAGAGSGKTSALVALSSYMEGSGFYLAFNKSIADEAQGEFPSNVTCKTAHSLAFQAEGKPYAKRLSRLNGEVVVDQFNHDAMEPLNEVQLANIALSTLRSYCFSADRKISVRHIPEQSSGSLLDPIDDPLVRADIEDVIVLLARKIWKEMGNKRSKFPVTHDFYLKKWALSDPIIKADFIMLDEAQDSNDVLIDVVGKQDAQVIYVGDRFQAIYGWRGAANAMTKIDTDDMAIVSQSFRFGEAIAGMANEILHNQLHSEFTIRGFNKISSSIGELSRPDAILCRTNAVCMETAVDLLKQGRKVKFLGDQQQLLSQIAAVHNLKSRGVTDHPDFKGFVSYHDLVAYSESEEGCDFKSLLGIIRKYGEKGLQEFISEMDSFTDPETTVVTAHKSKGLEWNDVKLAGDFVFPEDKRWQEEESHLLYVAVTRAKKQLDISEIEKKLFPEEARLRMPSY